MNVRLGDAYVYETANLSNLRMLSDVPFVSGPLGTGPVDGAVAGEVVYSSDNSDTVPIQAGAYEERQPDPIWEEAVDYYSNGFLITKGELMWGALAVAGLVALGATLLFFFYLWVFGL